MSTGILTGLLNRNTKSFDKHRDYIGASSLGKGCERSIWYQYNNYPKMPTEAKMLRTFNIGKRLEFMVLDYLVEAGLTLIRPCPENRFLHYKDEQVPQMQGHLDAIWSENPANSSIIEVKSARNASFKVFRSLGLYSWSQSYFSQLQTYMGLADIPTAYIIAIDKDTSDIHDEFVQFDPEFYENLREKALRIVNAQSIPAKINTNPCYFLCRNCEFRKICHE